MMRCGENNHHVHDGYEKEMAPSSDVNDTDEDESKNSILHEPFDEPSLENLIMDVSKLECNIVNKTSSQSDSSDIPTNVISELNYDDHIEPSANVKKAKFLQENILFSIKVDQLIMVHMFQDQLHNPCRKRVQCSMHCRNGFSTF